MAESKVTQITTKVLISIAVMMGLFHLYTAFFGVLTAMLQRSVHLGFALTIAYLVAIEKGKSHRDRITGLLLALTSFISVFYIVYNFKSIIMRFGEPNAMDQFVGLIIILLVLDFARRATGNVLPAIALTFLVYAVAGPYLPGMLWHRGYDIQRIIYQTSLSTEGIFGLPLGVSAQYIFLFVLFGALLEVTGVGQFYIDLAIRAVGLSPGGPAKAAVVASSLFGTVSGSAVANVVSTGAVTIPLMKSVGYPAAFAGAVEAVASTGGQIMPPIMGSAAFIMAEILGIPYYKVALGALIPAVIYYGAVFAMVHFTARRQGLQGTDTSKMPTLGAMFRQRGLFVLPMIVLIYFMVIARISVTKAAVYSVAVTILIGFIGKMSFKSLVKAFETGARTSLVVVASTACAGIIVSVINLTGLGMKFSSVIVSLAAGSLFLTLVFIMLASLLLGMGLPTTPAYLILAVLGAPALVRLGADPLASHMFVFYFGAISMITPPVALAVFAASSVAKADFWKTAINACLLGLPAFFVPYMFVYDPVLLWKGTSVEIIIALATALAGAVILGAGLAGWLLRWCNIVERVVLVASGFLLISPGLVTNYIGLAGVITILLLQHRSRGILKGGTLIP